MEEKTVLEIVFRSPSAIIKRLKGTNNIDTEEVREILEDNLHVEIIEINEVDHTQEDLREMRVDDTINELQKRRG